MQKTDHIDKEILMLLKADGRTPYASIAKKVGLTSTAVSQRVQKMTDEGIIQGFEVKLNLEKLGRTIQAIITLKLNFAKMERFYETLKTCEEIEYGYRVTEEDCIIMKVNLRDNAHLLDFINRISKYGFSKSNIIIEKVV